MLPDRFEAITVTDVEGLLEAFRARKEALELSNATIDELGGLCAGHADKVLGPSRIKGLSTMTLDVLLGVLALKLVVVEYPEAAARIVDRWGIRSKPHVRARCSRVSMKVLESARPVILKELSAKAAEGRKAIPAEKRSEIARNAACSRWRKERFRSPM